jgi:hypothetical protein
MTENIHMPSRPPKHRSTNPDVTTDSKQVPTWALVFGMSFLAGLVGFLFKEFVYPKFEMIDQLNKTISEMQTEKTKEKANSANKLIKEVCEGIIDDVNEGRLPKTLKAFKKCLQRIAAADDLISAHPIKRYWQPSSYAAKGMVDLPHRSTSASSIDSRTPNADFHSSARLIPQVNNTQTLKGSLKLKVIDPNMGIRMYDLRSTKSFSMDQIECEVTFEEQSDEPVGPMSASINCHQRGEKALFSMRAECLQGRPNTPSEIIGQFYTNSPEKKYIFSRVCD